LPRRDIAEEENLLIEAVSLLVQRQRDTEERYAQLETRLAEIEAHLSRVAAAGAADERLALLRDQLEELRGESEPRAVRSVGVTSLEARRQPTPTFAAAAPPTEPVTPAARAPAASPSAWDIFGATPRHRFAFLLIVVGVLAVLYSAFLLIRFG
jgi:hypothetical protein